VDDELHARENLSMLLSDYCPEVEIVGMAGSVNQARELINKVNPDVVFLDIRMPSGAEGFELLDSIPEKKFQVVFVTAFKDYAIKAFNANAIHYILKPVDIDDLRLAVEKLLNTRKMLENHPENLSNYIKSLENLTQSLHRNLPVQRITIHHTRGFKIVDYSDIIYLEADGNCTRIHFKDDSMYLDTRTLKVYEDMLDKKYFFRIHKSYMLNLSYVKEYIHEDGHFAILHNGVRLPVSRNNLKEFVELLKRI